MVGTASKRIRGKVVTEDSMTNEGSDNVVPVRARVLVYLEYDAAGRGATDTHAGTSFCTRCACH